jgi:hypothetical protein
MKGFYALITFVVAFAAMNATLSRADKSPTKHGNGVLIGHVVFPDGKPAAGIRIMGVLERPYIWELTQKGFLKRTPGGVFTEEARQFFAEQQDIAASSQADGSFRLEGLITGPYDLLVTAKPGKLRYYMVGMPLDWTAPAAVGVWGKQNQTVRRSQNIVLTRGVVIHGKVIDTDDKPLSGVDVASTGPHRPDSSDSAAAVITDENGEYSMRVPPGEITVYLAGPSTIYSKLQGKLKVTLNGKLIKGDKNFKAQIKFPVSTEKSDVVNYQFLPKVPS